MDRAVVVVEMEPDQAYFLTRGVQSLVDASAVKLFVAGSRENIPVRRLRDC